MLTTHHEGFPLTMATEETAVVPVTNPANRARQNLRIRPTANPLGLETVYQQIRCLYHPTRAAVGRRW